MARIIFSTRYLKNAPEKKLRNLVNYMATRPGVEVLKGIDFTRPATENQKRFISETMKLLPEIKDSFEYEDYMANPIIGNASELISSIAENNIDKAAGLKNYVDYIAKRPKAERSSDGHGLWSSTDEKINLSKVADEVASHKGNIWTHIISLRREDAERLGYDNAAAWRDLVRSKVSVISDSMGIPLDDLRWYGAYHDMGHHPHIHLMVYSENQKKGFLKEPGIEKMRSAFGTSIFRNDLMHVYTQKDEIRKELNHFADERVKLLAEQINIGEIENPVVSELLVMLSQELKKVKGKKDYGWLKGTPKKLVDDIVIELSKDRNMAEIYAHWCDLKNEIAKTYMKNPPKHGELVNEQEFRKIKNMIIRYAKDISDVDMDTLKLSMEDKSEIIMDETPVDDSDFFADGADSIEMPEEFSPTDAPVEIELTEDAAATPVVSYYAKWTDEYKKARQHLYGKGAPQNYEKAYEMFLTEAEKGNALALYDVGKMHLAGLSVEMDEAVAQEWFAKAHDAFVSVEAATCKDYIQYRMGKLYNLGHGVEIDYAKAAEWFEKSAEQGNQFAQYSLGGLYFYGNGVEQSYKKAFDLYTESYEQNNTFAAYELGKMYRNGIGTEIDTEESQECFAVAYAGFVKIEKENGGDQLQHRLGQMCIAGEGTEINIPKAVDYFKKAVELGNVHSMHALTKLHMDGKSDEIDILHVIERLTKAAEKENDFAQFSLGRFYAFDKTERDMEKALHWLTKSADQGNEYAAKLIEYLNNPQYQMSAGSAAMNLLKHLSKIIADDYQEQMKKYDAMIDKKLMKKIIQKKQEHGMKQTFE